MTATTARRLLTAALLVWGLYDLTHAGRGTPVLDGVDLAIHETGHLVFGPFGEFIGFAGGTLFQLIMPALFAGYFWRRGDRHAASVALWWVGQNCGHIATYVADARAQELPLVGGGEHDWFYLLSATGHLPQDVAIARAIRAAGMVLVVGASAWGFIAAGRRPVDDDTLPSTVAA
ncbi:MAG: hypothetical protein HOQ14_13910 [Gemmatimonadaceae bacterium]|nr:hypothetical protein [Gemmatimonadaceae bacterium]